MDTRLRSLLWKLRHTKSALSTVAIISLLLLSALLRPDQTILTPFNAPHNHHHHSYCQSIQSLYYVKIHKTGSTTFQNLLYRLGMRQDLFFALFDCNYGMPYPNTPNYSLLYSDPTHPRFKGHFHLLTDHAVFDIEATRSYMPEKMAVVTLLRHPLEQLKSTFEFFKLADKFGIGAKSREEAIKVFLEDPARYDQLTNYAGCQSSSRFSQTRNPQSHHLGLRNQLMNDLDILESFVHAVEQKIGLVLILEKFEESLLLFRRMFCLSTKDILHLNLFSRSFLQKKFLLRRPSANVDLISSQHKDTTDAKRKIEHLISQHKEWSKADYIVYNYFLEKHARQVEAIGTDFQAELESFHQTKKLVRGFCATSCTVFHEIMLETVEHAWKRLTGDMVTIPRSAWSEEFTVTHADCLLMMLETAVYNNAIKLKQWPDICARQEADQEESGGANRRYPRINKVMQCADDTEIIPHFRWEAIRDSIYFNKDICLAQF